MAKFDEIDRAIFPKENSANKRGEGRQSEREGGRCARGIDRGAAQ